MTAYAQLVIAITLVILAGLTTNQFNQQNKMSTEIAIEQQVRSLAAYIDSAAEYKQKNGGTVGNVTNKLTLPAWMLARAGITVYAESGNYYVFLQNKPGLMTALRKKSFNSAKLGRIENSSIRLTDGSVISKPAVIPSNSLVYII